MNRATVSALLLAAVGLSACGQAGNLGALVVSNALGTRTSAPALYPAIDARSMIVTLPSKGIKFAMVPIENDGNVTIWAAQDGSQLALQGGVLLWTRGFGADLMSSDAPSLGDLRRDGASHTRIYHYFDGADAPVRQSYACTVSQLRDPSAAEGLKHMQETCRSGQTSLVNDFWFTSAGTVAKSAQFLSSGIGYVEF